MSANPPPTPPARTYPDPTEADGDAMFASAVWFREQRSAGAFEKYRGMHVAILAEQIIDADRDRDALVRRLESLGDSLPPNRVVIQYVPGPADWYW